MSDTDRLAEAVHDVICTTLADYDSHEPGDIRYLCDPAPFRASLERLEIQPAAPADFGEQVLISNAAGERIVREGLAKRQPAAPAEGLHQWTTDDKHDYEWCRVCLLVRQANGSTDAKRCKGAARVTLRSAAPAEGLDVEDFTIRTVTTPDGQVYTHDCGAYHPDHPGTRCRQPEGHSGEHATARRDVTWDNAYLSAPPAAPAEGL